MKIRRRRPKRKVSYRGESLPEKQIVHIIQSGDSTCARHIKTQSCTRSKWKILVDEEWIPIVYDKNHKCIATMLSENILDKIFNQYIGKTDFADLYKFLRISLGCDKYHSPNTINEYIYCYYTKEKASSKCDRPRDQRGKKFCEQVIKIMEELNLILKNPVWTSYKIDGQVCL